MLQVTHFRISLCTQPWALWGTWLKAELAADELVHLQLAEFLPNSPPNSAVKVQSHREHRTGHISNIRANS